MWLCRLPDWAKAELHWLHLNGFVHPHPHPSTGRPGKGLQLLPQNRIYLQLLLGHQGGPSFRSCDSEEANSLNTEEECQAQGTVFADWKVLRGCFGKYTLIDWLHWEHLYLLTPLWVCLWALRLLALEKVLGHRSQDFRSAIFYSLLDFFWALSPDDWRRRSLQTLIRKSKNFPFHYKTNVNIIRFIWSCILSTP